VRATDTGEVDDARVAGDSSVGAPVTSVSERRVSEQRASDQRASDERGIVRAARGGDRQAFGLLYEAYARMVHGILLTRVPPSEADDLAQEVFLKAMRELPRLRDDCAFGGWLASIARNRAHDYHRRRRATSELPEDLASPDASDRDAHEMRAVWAALQGLPRTYRESLILRLVEGMTGPEIARRTGLQPGSVRVNLHRGMKMLRERLQLGESVS